MTFGEDFLTYPDLFPARPGGEAAGPEERLIQLAGRSFQISGLTPYQANLLSDWLGDLVQPLPLPDKTALDEPVQTFVYRAPSSDFKTVEMKDWTFDSDYGPNWVGLAGWDFMARLDWRPGLQGSLWVQTRDDRMFRGVIENYLRVLLAYVASERNGVLLHSAGVVSEGSGFVFWGVSGAGKTTVSKLSRDLGKQIVSDDMNVLKEESGEVRIHQIPFWGSLDRTESPGSSWPVRALCSLAKGDRNHLEKMSPAESLARLLVCSPFVNSDLHRRPDLIQNLERIVGLVPCYRLTFTKKESFWPLLEEIQQND